MNEYGGGRLSGAVYVSYYYPAPNSTEGLGEHSRGVRWNWGPARCWEATKREEEVQ